MIDIDGEPWFVSQEVCRVLGVHVRSNGSVNTHAALSKLAADQRQNLPYVEAKQIGLQHSASRAYGLSLISESGFYRLVTRSDKPEALEFQDWVTRVVLPAIRKDGGYIMGEEKVATGGTSRQLVSLGAGLGPTIAISRCH